MDDMQRYRDIKAEATDDDPTAKLRAQLAVAFDQALAHAIRLERQGKPGKVRALGFTETADLLAEPRCPNCDHHRNFHGESGCWFTATTGEQDANLVCPCSLPHPTP